MVALRIEPGPARAAEKSITLDAAMLRDEGVSLEAIGLYAHLYDLASEGAFEPSVLKKQLGLGQVKYSRLVRELNASGWLIKRAKRDVKSQCFGEMEFLLRRSSKSSEGQS